MKGRSNKILPPDVIRFDDDTLVEKQEKPEMSRKSLSKDLSEEENYFFTGMIKLQRDDDNDFEFKAKAKANGEVSGKNWFSKEKKRQDRKTSLFKSFRDEKLVEVFSKIVKVPSSIIQDVKEKISDQKQKSFHRKQTRERSLEESFLTGRGEF